MEWTKWFDRPNLCESACKHNHSPLQNKHHFTLRITIINCLFMPTQPFSLIIAIYWTKTRTKSRRKQSNPMDEVKIWRNRSKGKKIEGSRMKNYVYRFKGQYFMFSTFLLDHVSLYLWHKTLFLPSVEKTFFLHIRFSYCFLRLRCVAIVLQEKCTQSSNGFVKVNRM